MSSMMFGILISGWLISRFTVRKSIIPITATLAILDLGYLFLSLKQFNNPWLITLIIIGTQFGLGLANGAYMSFLLHRFGGEQHKTSFYAIGTGLMALGITLFGAISGWVQHLLTYRGFFVWIFLLTIGILFYTIYTLKKIILTE
jgi:MFS transporter, PAT family, beta-lactamase induction signal transducer AmpG